MKRLLQRLRLEFSAALALCCRLAHRSKSVNLLRYFRRSAAAAFMRGIPNFIPLSEKGVRAVGEALIPLAFDRVYGHHFERVIHSGAKQILQSLRGALRCDYW